VFILKKVNIEMLTYRLISLLLPIIGVSFAVATFLFDSLNLANFTYVLMMIAFFYCIMRLFETFMRFMFFKFNK